MRSSRHATLVDRAARWLRNTRKCGVVLTEWRNGSAEHPDAIGWRNGGLVSVLVECKVSVADFRADLRKSSRRRGETSGRERWYLTRPGLIKPEWLPDEWGLIEAHPRRIATVVEAGLVDLHPRCEIQMLYSALWRVAHGRAEIPGLHMIREDA